LKTFESREDPWETLFKCFADEVITPAAKDDREHFLSEPGIYASKEMIARNNYITEVCLKFFKQHNFITDWEDLKILLSWEDFNEKSYIDNLKRAFKFIRNYI